MFEDPNDQGAEDLDDLDINQNGDDLDGGADDELEPGVLNALQKFGIDPKTASPEILAIAKSNLEGQRHITRLSQKLAEIEKTQRANRDDAPAKNRLTPQAILERVAKAAESGEEAQVVFLKAIEELVDQRLTEREANHRESTGRLEKLRDRLFDEHPEAQALSRHIEAVLKDAPFLVPLESDDDDEIYRGMQIALREAKRRAGGGKNQRAQRGVADTGRPSRRVADAGDTRKLNQLFKDATEASLSDRDEKFRELFKARRRAMGLTL